MRVAILYDCLFPHTVGGAERWYRQLAERLAADGHEVTYLTRRQWPAGEPPDEPFAVVEVMGEGELYTESGRRRIDTPLRFGWGTFMHLLRRGGGYDIVHGASFPYFSVIGAWLALLPHRRTKLVVDWHEVWTLGYWRAYLGPLGGPVGFVVQAICKRLPDANFTMSRMHAARLPAGSVQRLTGEFVEGARPAAPASAEAPPHIVFAGRHIPEKNAAALPAALAAARAQVPGLTATIFGDGPESGAVREAIRRVGGESFIEQPGFVASERVHATMSRAACMVLPSVREGYGLVVVEALSLGTPAVVVQGPDNAATELIESGVNGLVAASANPEVLGTAIVRAIQGGEELRRSTWDWYEANRAALSIEDSLEKIEAAYARLTGSRSQS